MTPWKESSLGDACELYQPKTLSSAELVDDGEYLVYGANGVIGRYDQYNHEDAEILVTCRGATCGTVNISEPKSWINGNAMVVKPRNSELDFRFLQHLLRGGIDLSVAITGAAQPQITRQSLAPIKFKYPPLPEQRRIAAILDKADALRTKRREALAQLDRLTQSIFIEMFGDPVSNSRGWEVARLGDLVSKLGSGSTPTGGDAAYKESGISLIRSLNVHDGEFVYKNLAFIDDIQAGKLSNVVVKEGDVLLNITGASVARVCSVPKNVLPARVNQHVMIVRPKSTLNSIYLERLLLNPQMKARLLQVGGAGATREAITKAQAAELAIPLPPLDLQGVFAQRVSAVQELQSCGGQSLEELDSLFASLQQRAFRGEL